MASKDENDVINALTGFSLNNILDGLSLPGGAGLSNQLGISGSNLSSKQIYNDDFDEDAIGNDQGEDWEAQIEHEFENEVVDDSAMQYMQARQVKTKEKRIHVVKKLVPRPKSVYERFPAFEKDRVLDFSELFKGNTISKSRLAKRPFQIESVYPRRRENPRNFLDSIAGDTRRQVENKRVQDVVSAGSVEVDLRKALDERNDSEVPISLSLDDRSFDLVLLSNWEDQIIYDADISFSEKPQVPESTVTAPANKALESGAWTQSIIWSPDAPFRDFTQLELNPEDIIVPETRSDDLGRPRKRFRTDLSIRDKFNLSNDQFYEISKDARHRVRQTFGQLTVEHAYPAQKLQLPFYKTRLSKIEARSFHRPALQFPANIEIHFTKVRTAKKKKDRSGRRLGKGGNVGEGLHSTSDLSLRDTSNFVLWEYSEEHPPIIPNFGMGSSLVNYYRKKEEKDDHIPKYELGVPFVLEPQDDSPFMKFGAVYPGQTVPALYNNLVRAPLFRQKAYNTDFLVIKHTVKGETKYYIRDIKNLFVVGQTYPVTEVPGPHSRKITNTIKYRLQIIAFKLLRKSAGERLKISRLMKYFPDQNELQMRQRLKEFMEYHRRGPHQGFWRLKPNLSIPSDAEMLKMVSPEQVVLMESMQVGQRHLQDSGYSQNAEGSADGDDSNLSIEQQLAPWITTKNFLLATQAKAMLRLHGEGDPSGRGEAFSFIRISMKEIFVKAGEDYEQKMAEAENRPKSAHRYNVAEQQVIYKSEIERIWKAQFDSLSRKDEPPLTAEDIRADGEATRRQEAALKAQQAAQAAMMMPYGYFTGLAGPNQAAASPSAGTPGRESMEPDAASQKRVLRIKRLVDGEWHTEIVRDPGVIRAYIRNKQLMEEEQTKTDSLAPTGDAEKDKRAMKRLEEEIARMKKNQERRLHRKNAKIVKEGGTPLTLDRPMKPDTTRRCGHCGQMGHMKTNRKCPRWEEFNSGAAPIATPSTSSGQPAATVNAPNLGFTHAPFSPSPLGAMPAASPTEEPAKPAIKLTLKK
ncbi:TAF1 transcription initiation factor TFIID subunit TAF1 [Cylindrobasidium torrendii FP15055 ss-10]|uniref:TAF1 transcription initiation factor TFIID subunit TAF1 n=1 Tax=Cylindrobasidium torrendii FP15055 ss-10 TaxID=1314674 RepID=A0A0D7BAE9_9AGAR|nr:TAF1 transcription initiation factor TFIID subunit TAF1 [Cylindrobasidium torrendii FP15055 ss-10]